MDPHEKIAAVVRMLNSLSSTNFNQITVAKYYEYSCQELMIILADLLSSVDPSFNQQVARHDKTLAEQEILHSLSIINYEPSQEIVSFHYCVINYVNF